MALHGKLPKSRRRYFVMVFSAQYSHDNTVNEHAPYTAAVIPYYCVQCSIGSKGLHSRGPLTPQTLERQRVYWGVSSLIRSLLLLLLYSIRCLDSLFRKGTYIPYSYRRSFLLLQLVLLMSVSLSVMIQLLLPLLPSLLFPTQQEGMPQPDTAVEEVIAKKLPGICIPDT